MYNNSMDIRQYTDEKYIPLSDLASMGESFVVSTMEYRETFMEIIPVSDLEFANIVETPKLVKKRYSKNVELKGRIDIEAKNNDFILEIALKIVKGEEVPRLDQATIQNINKKYISNNKDLTIITNWLVNNIEKLVQNSKEDVAYIMPELNANDIAFINIYNKETQHYTINDYIKMHSTSYETGRKALEKLTKLKLYSKNKLGKKFVYQPSIKLINIMKGGKYGN